MSATSDRELLEAAARAAGMRFAMNGDNLPGLHVCGPDWRYGWRYWNPVESDADAFTLARLCGLTVMPYPCYESPKHSVVVQKLRLAEEGTAVVELASEVEIYGTDPDAATRRAIVRAAAALSPKGDAP